MSTTDTTDNEYHIVCGICLSRIDLKDKHTSCTPCGKLIWCGIDTLKVTYIPQSVLKISWLIQHRSHQYVHPARHRSHGSVQRIFIDWAGVIIAWLYPHTRKLNHGITHLPQHNVISQIPRHNRDVFDRHLEMLHRECVSCHYCGADRSATGAWGALCLLQLLDVSESRG